MMKFVRSKIAVLALVASAVPSLAGDMDAVKFRNCTWCHGESAQGYGAAPRLAAQRPQYIENQLLSFRKHTRDNPFSKQYRSEEHTSELQSLRHLVCRLLLEKKK